MSSTKAKLTKNSTHHEKNKNIIVLLTKEQLRHVVAEKYFSTSFTEADQGQGGALKLSTNYPIEKESDNLKPENHSLVQPLLSLPQFNEKLVEDANKNKPNNNEFRSDTAILYIQRPPKGARKNGRKYNSPALAQVKKKVQQDQNNNSEVKSSEIPPEIDASPRMLSNTVLVQPKEYSCIVTFIKSRADSVRNTTTQREEQLTIFVSQLRSTNFKINTLYHQWHSHLEYLFQHQLQIVNSQNPRYFEWCIFEIHIQLLEGISTALAPFFVSCHQFQKRFHQKSFRKTAVTFLKNEGIGQHFSQVMLTSSSLKGVLDEYLEDLKADYEKLRNLIRFRKLVKEIYQHYFYTKKEALLQWKIKTKTTDCYTSWTSAISDRYTLAERASHILPWNKLIKKTLALHKLEQLRVEKLEMLDKKYTKLIRKASANSTKPKFQKSLLKIEYKIEMRRSFLEYKHWKRKSEIIRNYCWKYHIRYFFGPKSQQSWIMNKNRIVLANKIRFGCRKASLMLKLDWDLRKLKARHLNIESDYCDIDIPFTISESEIIETTHYVSIHDIWKPVEKKVNVSISMVNSSPHQKQSNESLSSPESAQRTQELSSTSSSHLFLNLNSSKSGCTSNVTEYCFNLCEMEEMENE